MAPRVDFGSNFPRAFFDSNILVYADDPRDTAKQEIALRLIEDYLNNQAGVLSLQVLQEYFVTVTRKHKLDAGLVKRKIEIYANFHVVEPKIGDVLAAIDLHRLHGFSYWDSLILHGARKAGCRVLLSEDMQHGRVVDGVEIVNPFL
jgi:predicted nucleic acid-binding protein